MWRFVSSAAKLVDPHEDFPSSRIKIRHAQMIVQTRARIELRYHDQKGLSTESEASGTVTHKIVKKKNGIAGVNLNEVS